MLVLHIIQIINTKSLYGTVNSERTKALAWAKVKAKALAKAKGKAKAKAKAKSIQFVYSQCDIV